MARKEIGTRWDRVNRNAINDNFTEVYNKDINMQNQINILVLESGESDLEVAQARGGHQVLNERLNSIDSNMAQITQEINQIGTTIINRTNGLATEVITPTATITLSRDDYGVVQSAEEEKSGEILKTTYLRDSDGSIQQIDREMI